MLILIGRGVVGGAEFRSQKLEFSSQNVKNGETRGARLLIATNPNVQITDSNKHEGFVLEE
jgi:hypothetical protein